MYEGKAAFAFTSLLCLLGSTGCRVAPDDVVEAADEEVAEAATALNPSCPNVGDICVYSPTTTANGKAVIWSYGSGSSPEYSNCYISKFTAAGYYVYVPRYDNLTDATARANRWTYVKSAYWQARGSFGWTSIFFVGYSFGAETTALAAGAAESDVAGTGNPLYARGYATFSAPPENSTNYNHVPGTYANIRGPRYTIFGEYDYGGDGCTFVWPSTCRQEFVTNGPWYYNNVLNASVSGMAHDDWACGSSKAATRDAYIANVVNWMNAL